MVIAPCNVLTGGRIRSDEEERKRDASGEGGRTLGGIDWKRTDNERKVCDVLEKIGTDVGGAKFSADMPLHSPYLPILKFHCTSCYCIANAQGTLCLSDCWWSKNRAPARKREGLVNFSYFRPDRVVRRSLAV